MVATWTPCRCGELVHAYLQDSSPEAQLLVGGDLRKIQLCFQIFKVQQGCLSTIDQIVFILMVDENFATLQNCHMQQNIQQVLQNMCGHYFFFFFQAEILKAGKPRYSDMVLLCAIN